MSKLISGRVTKLLRQFSDLTKFKLSVLNGLVTSASFSLYASEMSCLPLFASSVVLSMSTQTLNQYIEIEYDKKMVRTSQRPLVLGLNPNVALTAGLAMGALGILGLYTYNPITAALGAAIWAGYLFVYTTLKSKSESNTFIGSIVGSLPVYLGWAASGRSMCMVEPFAIFMYMMAWQHQHFYGIRWIYFDDYNQAGFKMEKDKQFAAAQVIFQTILSMVLVNYSIRYYEISNCFLLNIPLTIGLYRWGIKSAIDFAEGKIDARSLKMQSYKHFFLVFGVFLICKLIGKSEAADIDIRKRNLTQVDDSRYFDSCL